MLVTLFQIVNIIFNTSNQKKNTVFAFNLNFLIRFYKIQTKQLFSIAIAFGGAKVSCNYWVWWFIRLFVMGNLIIRLFDKKFQLKHKMGRLIT